MENHPSERRAILISGPELIEQGFGPASIACADEQPGEQSDDVRRHRHPGVRFLRVHECFHKPAARGESHTQED